MILGVLVFARSSLIESEQTFRKCGDFELPQFCLALFHWKPRGASRVSSRIAKTK